MLFPFDLLKGVHLKFAIEVNGRRKTNEDF